MQPTEKKQPTIKILFEECTSTLCRMKHPNYRFKLWHVEIDFDVDDGEGWDLGTCGNLSQVFRFLSLHLPR